MAIGVYKIVNKVNGKTYVGASMNTHRRWIQHKAASKIYGGEFYKDIREFGIENFEFIVLEECALDNLRKLELKYYNELDPEYNSKPPVQLSKKQLLEKGKLLSIAQKGKRHTKETRAKMSASHKGVTSTFKGKRHTKETRAKMSASHKGVTSTFKGKKHTKEAKAKASAAMKKYWEGRSEKEKRERNAKISATIKKRITSFKGKRHTKETRAKMSASHKGKKFSKEHKAKLSAARKKWWENKRKEQNKDV